MPPLTLQRKAFLALAALLVALLVIFLAFSRLGLERGLGAYVAEVELARMDWLAERLQAHHAEHGGWERLRSQPELWRQMRRPDGAGRRPPPPLPPPPDIEPPPHERRALHDPPPDSRGGPPPEPTTAVGPPNTMNLGNRLGLLDAQGQPVAGATALPYTASMILRAANGARIGTLVLAPPQIGQTDADQAFFAQHLVFVALTGLTGLALALLLSMWLARRWLGPIDALTQGARAVAAGRLDTRVVVAGQDELAQLANTFNRMAQELAGMEQSRRQWLADVAHELRTPLAAMRAEIEAVQDSVRTFDASTAQRLHRQVMRLIHLVQDLRASLDASDPHASPTGPAVPIAPLPMLHEALAIMQPRLEQAHITVDTTGLHALEALKPQPLVTGQAEPLHRVFLNLIENTLRYTDAGGHLELSGRITGTAPGRMLELQWDDTAPGVQPHELPRLFERLFRAEASRSRNNGDLGGSGLGLAICRAIVQAHGGRIQAQASPLGGLRILIQLPLEKRS